ncbi:hypothetical protein OC845_005380 [Tilletia horrida]|nr:hypothetical protein OC845_005380 [Tilletia horrida]
MRTFTLVTLFTLLILISEIDAHSSSPFASSARRSQHLSLAHRHHKSGSKSSKSHSHHKSVSGPAISKGAAVKPQTDDKATGKDAGQSKPEASTGSPSSSGSGSSCTFTDIVALEAGKKSCKSIILNNIQIPAGKTLDLTGLDPGVAVTFAGKTTFGYKEWKGPLIAADGQITITGAPGHVIDCQGGRWYDGKGSNGGKIKPKFFALHAMMNTVVSDLNILTTPVQAFSISDSSHLTLNNIRIDDRPGGDLGHNTDAFDVGTSTFITINNATVFNHDDCLAINSGTDIVFKGGYCNGGHGISVGSVGNRDVNTVARVNVTDCDVVNSMNGARIKTIAGATGKVDTVTFSNLRLSGITDAGIVVIQDYLNGGPTGKPTSGVPITNLRMIDITGTVDNKAMPIQIKCGAGACKDWQWDSNITGGTPADDKNCMNIPPSVKKC